MSYEDTLQMQTVLASVGAVIASPQIDRRRKSDTAPRGGGSRLQRRSRILTTRRLPRPIRATSAPCRSGQSVPVRRPRRELPTRTPQAFTAFRKAREQARVRQAEQVVENRLDSFATEASRQTPEYLSLQQRLADLQILEATATGNFTILAPAAAPDAPFTPRPVRNGLMGMVAGLVLGVGIALTVAQFDTRVRSQDEAVALFGMPLWGQIRKMPKGTLDDEPLVVLDESHSQSAEAYSEAARKLGVRQRRPAGQVPLHHQRPAA